MGENAARDLSSDTPATSGKKITLMLVDDHYVARFGIRKLFALYPDDFTVLGEANNGAAAVTLYREHHPDIVLMDLRMDGFDGVSATKAIRAHDPNARIVILSSYDTEQDVHRAIAAGAQGFVVKEAGPSTLLEAVRQVSAGQRYLPDNIKERLDNAEGSPGLTAREMQLLRMLVAGMSNREIAARTSLTLGTVKVYVCHMLAKLGVSNRSEAVFEAMSRGLIRGQTPLAHADNKNQV